MNRTGSEAGFTLVEALITMVISGLHRVGYALASDGPEPFLRAHG